MIDVSTTFNIAIRAIKANKMRSILTSLGIIIGVAAVIVMLSIGNGAQITIQKEMKSMGSNLIMIRSGTSTSGGQRMGHGSQPTLKSSDGNAIEEKIASIKIAAPVLSDAGQIVYGNANWSTSITGTDNRYFEIKEWNLAYGRYFSETDIKNAGKVAILGTTVVKELFGDLDPLGRTIRVKGIPFTVIGVTESRGQSGPGMDQDDTIYIPLSTAQKKVTGIEFPDMVKMIMLQAVDAKSTYTSQEEIRALLRQRHNLGANKDDDFVIRNLTQMMEMMENSTKVLTVLLGSIASISLLVGGIGIMNIMLVSVTERTREIGIRMAIGAKSWDIRLQFLTEALVLSLIGGLIGVIIGLIGAWLISAFSSFSAVVSIFYVLLPFTVAGLVGLFFGFYPAYKASLLNPINALRYE
ncbi:MAG: FtsX-like permease family protein [Alphaproteobacteria bacterium]|nr:FtsX-like permease family protein [Alphaproteobacteria bacterium]